jgi:hypothetical protein
MTDLICDLGWHSGESLAAMPVQTIRCSRQQPSIASKYGLNRQWLLCVSCSALRYRYTDDNAFSKPESTSATRTAHRTSEQTIAHYDITYKSSLIAQSEQPQNRAATDNAFHHQQHHQAKSKRKKRWNLHPSIEPSTLFRDSNTGLYNPRLLGASSAWFATF